MKRRKASIRQLKRGALASTDPDRTNRSASFFLTPQEISMNTMITSRSPRRILATAILGAFACTLATVCTAAEANLPQMTVKYADLDVSKPQGAAALYARIKQAARQVCLPLEDRDFRSKAHDACVHKAIADAVAKVDLPELFAVYNAHNGKPTPIVLAATEIR
jgi:UrcA family protein